MRRSALLIRSLTFFWRTHLAVVLGATVGAAVLTGALIVGDSMRASLKDAALGRLGRVDYSLASGRFFREELAGDIASASEFSASFSAIAPVIRTPGGVTHADSGARRNRVNVLGVDQRFWEMRGDADLGATIPAELAPQSIIINKPLADELGAAVGDDLLVRLGKPGDISTETLLGRRDDTVATLRLTIQTILPAVDIGAFSLTPQHLLPRNAYIPLNILQRSMDKRGRVNTMLVASRDESDAALESLVLLERLLAAHADLADLGLTLRENQQQEYLSLESDSMLLPPAMERAAREAAAQTNLIPMGIQVYLANRIDRGPSTAGIPFSTVAALDAEAFSRTPFRYVAGGAPSGTGLGSIVLNSWAADDLGVTPGDSVRLSYYVTGKFGQLETRDETFTLSGVVALEGAAADAGFTPDYKGVTDTENLADWDPPFPMDLSVVRDKDEAYWDSFRATPKAFIALKDAEHIWSESPERFGRLTSIRLIYADGGLLDAMSTAFSRALLESVELASVGMSFDAVRSRLSIASKGTTDFGGLFIGFSFFLITAAAMLVALLFRLGVEQRAGEVGLLLSIGYSPRTVTRMLVAEGAVLAAIGSAFGLIASVGYAWLMLAGLRSWWSDAVNTPFITLHASGLTLAIGYSGSLLVAIGSIAWSVRGLTRRSPISLLAGAVAAGTDASIEKAATPRVAVGAWVLAVVMSVLPSVTESVAPTIGFFVGGASMLTGCLAYFSYRLKRRASCVVATPGVWAMVQLGARNATRRSGRSVLTASLIASATFLIAAMQAFHVDAGASSGDRSSGAGGYALYAEAAVPLLFDLNTQQGRESLNLSPEAAALLTDTVVMPLRLRSGDNASCTNLYTPTKPRIVGAPEAMTQRGGFRFSSTLAESEEEKRNPWLLLDKTFDDGAIPVIGDESAVMWQLHLGLGKYLTITDGRGVEVRLRFVALLAGSALQDELIVSERQFEELFPARDGHGFFLIDVPEAHASAVKEMLERELASHGFDVGLMNTRLADYLAVQNTYLSTFQLLGGLGLILGTIGLAAVLMRNVLERRGELALLRALGYSHAAIRGIVLSETALLLFVGLAAGVASAMLAVAPHVVSRSTIIPWTMLGLTLFGVCATGLIAAIIAVASALRAPLLPALRAE